MVRLKSSTVLGAIVAPALVFAQVALAAPPANPPPITYEVIVNGESFLVDANRVARLESKTKPGVIYEVAVRVSPVQRLKLSTLQFQYDQGTKVEDNRQSQRRSVKLEHELGFTLLITDLGKTIEAESRDKALEILTQSVMNTFRTLGVKEEGTKVERLRDYQFTGAEGRGVRIQHHDAEGIAHTTLVYLLVGKTFTGTCIAQYLDGDSKDVLPLVRKVLDSIQGVERQR
jgi:hypothetical protein